MPWLPELFTAPVLQQVLDQRHRDELVAVPYFDGLLVGDPDPLVESFAGVPEVYDPVRGRIKGVPAFRAFVVETNQWLRERRATVEEVEHVVPQGRGFEEVVLHLDTERGTVDLPVAVVAERRPDGRIDEVRVYFSSEPLTGRRTSRLPLLQSDTGLTTPDAVTAYLRALAGSDLDGVVAAFEPDGYLRVATGGQVHQGAADLRAYHQRLLSDGGRITVESCGVTDDGRAFAVEHNVVQDGTTQPPQAGLAVFTLGASGRLAAARVYDDL